VSGIASVLSRRSINVPDATLTVTARENRAGHALVDEIWNSAVMDSHPPCGDMDLIISSNQIVALPSGFEGFGHLHQSLQQASREYFHVFDKLLSSRPENSTMIPQGATRVCHSLPTVIGSRLNFPTYISHLRHFTFSATCISHPRLEQSLHKALTGNNFVMNAKMESEMWQPLKGAPCASQEPANDDFRVMHACKVQLV
jgi:hypothetical protein